MAVCTFFGHRDCLETVKPHLRQVLVDLIVGKGVDTMVITLHFCTVSRQFLLEQTC